MVAHWKASGISLTQERLKEFLSYDPEGGIFAWLVARPGAKSNHPSGIGSRTSSGGRVISIDGRLYSSARLAWLYVHGKWPDAFIYHLNGDKDDDRIINLQDSALLRRPTFSRNELTEDRLRELVVYAPDTGFFTWLPRPGRSAGHTKSGIMGGVDTPQGYRKIGIEGHQYRAHRLAWLYMMGRWPAAFIDHINGVRDDNRWCNLREATASQNVHNSSGRPNRGLPKGVYHRANGKFCAQITIGVFDTPEEAHAAYMTAARQFFGEFARGE